MRGLLVWQEFVYGVILILAMMFMPRGIWGFVRAWRGHMSEPFFALRDVGMRFGGLRALNKFSMEVAKGSIHALIGPNGAGKSTAFNCVSRFYRPSEGDITFDGRSLLNVPQHGIAGIGIARTFQNIELCRGLTVLENVLVGMTSRTPSYFPFGPSGRRNRAEKAALIDANDLLERTGLARHRDTPAEQLDFGHQKMLDLRALACKPKLLLLDEPAAGLRNREIAALDALLVELLEEAAAGPLDAGRGSAGRGLQGLGDQAERRRASAARRRSSASSPSRTSR